MARGSIAKNKVIEIIKSAFGADYITTEGSKIYVWANDGTEKVQIALAMTCPKIFIENTNSNNLPKSAFEEEESKKETNDITPQEQETIRTLMKRLGL